MKNFSMRFKAQDFDSTKIFFDGIASDDDVEGGHVSRNGPGSELSFPVYNDFLEELGEELIRAGNVLKLLGQNAN